jgi:signal transduction histidine kinase
MREFGGKLELDSSPRGTTIRATVPQAPTTSAEAASA